MCNDYGLDSPASAIADAVFSHIQIPLRFPEGTPNFPARADIRILERAPVILSGAEAPELVQRPWAWKSPKGAPVFNFRSEGRHFRREDRVLIPADRFYEFTAPEAGARLKTKWRFTMPGAPLFAIAGIVKQGAFTMLTTAPGPDVAPYHGRQVAALPPERWGAWLQATEPEAEVLKALPAGSLRVEKAER